MEFIFGIFIGIRAFVSSLFGTPEPETVLVPAPIMTTREEAVPETATSTATTTPNPTGTKSVSAPKATPPASIPSSLPVVTTVSTTSATVVTPSVTQKSSKGSGNPSSTGIATGITIDIGDLKGITERDTIPLKAYAKFDDGTEKDVSTETVWSVVGPIGSTKGTTFTAKIGESLAEFGRAPGAIRAEWKDASGNEFTSETPIFYIEAYVPTQVETYGQ